MRYDPELKLGRTTVVVQKHLKIFMGGQEQSELTSEALEMSSRRKISLLEYKLLMIISISRLTSAWNSNFSPPARCCFNVASLQECD